MPLLRRFGGLEWPLRLVAALLILAATLVVFVRNRSLGLLGTDTYQLILASRVRSLDELVAVLTEPMGGGYLAPIYYRPLLHLSLAFDHALGGLDPLLYHGTSALIFAGACAALYFAAEQLLTGRARWGALIGLLLFLVHPVHAVTLPDPARRPELLSVAFLSLGVAAQARAARAGRRLPLLPALFTAAAALSKEATFVLPALCFATTWLMLPERRRAERLWAAGVATIPAALALLVVLALRLAVLGDALGERPLRSEGLAAAYAKSLAHIGLHVGSANAFVGEPSPPLLRVLTLFLASLLGALLARSELRSVALRESAPVLMLAGAWLALSALVYSLSGIQPWYLAIPAAALALGAAGLAGMLLRLAAEPRASRWAAAVGGVCLLSLTLDLAHYSPLFRSYPEWQQASARAERYLERLGARIEQARPGSVLHAAPPPIFLGGRRRSEGLDGVYVLSPKGIGAWAALRFDDRAVRVVEGRQAALTRRPDEVLVVLARPGESRARP